MSLNLIKMLAQRRDRDRLYATADYWDSKAKDLAGDAVSMWPNNHLNRLYHIEQIELISNTYDLRQRKVLDLGCGTGRLSRWLALRGADVTGVDFSEGALSIARKESKGNNPSYHCMSMFDIETDSAYDLVFCWASLTVATRNQAELANVMNRLFKALRPGGEILLLEPIHKGPLHRVLNMNLKEFKQEMLRAGFEIQFVRPLHFWPMRLLLAYIPWPKPITEPLYHLGQLLMKIPGFRSMGDYQGIHAIRK